MKIKLLSRNNDDYIRETKKDINKVPRNYDPKLHPMAAPREYTRAMNAVKLEKVFAKPFLGSFDGHRDMISCMSKHPQKLAVLFSGSYDGEVRIWNIPKKRCIKAIQAHDGILTGISFNTTNGYFYTCSEDKVIKQWSLDCLDDDQMTMDPMNTIIAKTSFSGMDHHRSENTFLTCGQRMDLWNEERVEPVWSCEDTYTSTCVRFNPSEVNYAAATYNNRSIALFDIRQHQTIRKVVLQMNSNSLSWNPMEPFYFTAANEDFNLYSFDMRKLDMPVSIHKDHTAAVMDIDYSPTGREFVAGSYDKSIRIFPSRGGHSREVYHTKRMQRVHCVQFSPDSKFVFSGSEEMNIRIWKANASEKLGVLKPREKEAMNYSEALKEKYANHPQVRRIAKHRHVPRHIYSASNEIKIIQASQKRKEANRRAHSKPGAVPYVPERKKKVVAEVE